MRYSDSYKKGYEILTLNIIHELQYRQDQNLGIMINHNITQKLIHEKFLERSTINIRTLRNILIQLEKDRFIKRNKYLLDTRIFIYMITEKGKEYIKRLKCTACLFNKYT